MRKFYFADLWRINEEDLFASRETLDEYISENWRDYALPVGDEVKFIGTREGKLNGALDIVYAVRDYDLETNNYDTDWVEETAAVWVDTVQLVQRTSDM